MLKDLKELKCCSALSKNVQFSLSKDSVILRNGPWPGDRGHWGPWFTFRKKLKSRSLNFKTVGNLTWTVPFFVRHTYTRIHHRIQLAVGDMTMSGWNLTLSLTPPPPLIACVNPIFRQHGPNCYSRDLPETLCLGRNVVPVAGRVSSHPATRKQNCRQISAMNFKKCADRIWRRPANPGWVRWWLIQHCVWTIAVLLKITADFLL